MWIFSILFSIFDLFSDSSSSSDREYSGPSDDWPSGPDVDHGGRWTQNEINIQHNIDMGMAVKDDE